jgi:hypothetical protein
LAAVAESELCPIYLLTGGDRPKIRRALERLRSHFGPESIEILSAEDTGGEEAVAAMNSLGLFAGAGGRLVVIEEVERWKKPDEDAVARYAADPVTGAVLALVAGDLKGSSLPALCAKVGEVLTFEVPRQRDLPTWVRAQFERLGVQADGEAARALVEIVGEDVSALATEVEKLSQRPHRKRPPGPSWTPGAPATFPPPSPPASPTSSTAPTPSSSPCDCPRRSRSSGRHMHWQTKASAPRTSPSVSASTSFACARRSAMPTITRAALDAALKGDSRLSGELELERAIVELVRSPEPAGRR